MRDRIRNQLRPRPTGDCLLREVLSAGGVLARLAFLFIYLLEYEHVR